VTRGVKSDPKNTQESGGESVRNKHRWGRKKMLISFSPSAAADILFTLLLLAGGGVCVRLPFEYSLSVPLLPTLSLESLCGVENNTLRAR
jgi:hypothetical protein